MAEVIGRRIVCFREPGRKGLASARREPASSLPIRLAGSAALSSLVESGRATGVTRLRGSRSDSALH